MAKKKKKKDKKKKAKKASPKKEEKQVAPPEPKKEEPKPEPKKEEVKAEEPKQPEETPSKLRDLQMWVGCSFYSSIESFVEEASRMGVSKRIGHAPMDLSLGETLLFLTHDEGKRIECADCNGTGGIGGVISLRLEERVSDEKGWHWGPVVGEDGNEKITIVGSGAAMKELRNSTYKESKEQRRHRKVEDQPRCERCKGWGRYPDGKIFGFCRLNAVEIVLDTAEAVKEYREREQSPEKKGKVVVTPVVGGEGVEEARGCGFRSIGGLYLVSGTNEAADELTALAKGLGAKFTVRGPFVELKTPVPYSHHRFFGTKLVDRREILGG